MTGDLAMRLRVIAVADEAEGVKSFSVARSDRRPFPHWAPGAHLDLALPPGLGRQYSLCGGSADGMTLRFAVLREPAGRGGSRFLHDAVAVGDTLEATGLRNNFPLVEAERYLLVAGGIGITPLLAMARQLEEWGRDWALLYGGRSRASMAFLPALEAFGGKVRVCPAEETGLLDIAGFLGADAPGKVAYCCGPEPLIAAVEAHCVDWPEEALQLERFHPREQAPPPAGEGGFIVELRKSGVVIEVPPDRTIADVAEDAGVYIPRSCNEGTCGTCITKVVEGLPDHRDSFLRPKQRAENKRIMPCCSRALSARLVLDV